MSTQYFQNFIRNYSNRLRLEGFNVINILDNKDEMPLFCGYSPTIYARDGNLERLIVVKPEEIYSDESEDVVSLKQYTRENHYTSYWGFKISAKSWMLTENII